MSSIKQRRLTPLALAMLGSVAPVFTLQALAQEAQTEEQDTFAVVVTASRAEESVSSIPGTVQVISAEQLKQGVAASGDVASYLSKIVPGLDLDNQTLSGAGQNFRGRSAQILVNGTPRTTALRRMSRALSLIDPGSIERIEIVNGASAVYGDGGTGGVINIITKAAEKEGLSGSVSSTISTSGRDLEDSLTIVKSVEASYRQGGVNAQFNGQFKDTGDMYDGEGRRISEDPLTGQGGGSQVRQYNISGQVEYEGDRADISLYANFVKMNQDIDYNSDYSSSPVSIDYDSPYQGEDPEEDSKNISAKLNVYEVGFLGDLQLEAYYNDAEKTSAYTPYGEYNPYKYKLNNTSIDDSYAQKTIEAMQIGSRVTLAKDIDWFVEGAHVTYGLDYSFNDIKQVLQDGQDIISPMKQHSYAAFGQLSVPVGNRFEFKAGVRHERFYLDVKDYTRPAGLYYEDDEDYELFYPLNSESDVYDWPNWYVAEAYVKGGKKQYKATVFNIGGVLHATDELDFFAGFSQGYSVPDVGSFTRNAVDQQSILYGADVNNGTPQTFDFSSIAPEAMLVNNYEIGTRFNDGKYAFSASGYVSTSDEGITVDAKTFEMQQQKEYIWGVEVNATAAINHQWNIGAVLAYNEGRYDSDGDGEIDADLPNSRIGSPYTATIYSDYRWDNGVSVHGEAVYGSSRSAHDGTENDSDYKLDHTFTVNASLAYDSDFGQFQIGAENLFDAEYMNTSATSVRNRKVLIEGQRFFLKYTKSF
ncbi:TonB-dependent receptor [Flexibacterium corallicola]|uniref:TonB-dependent receptor n=1 Tax=Flexibacterium corallicola TaxID=3037259 RepID=UPI00286F74E4|nr:TonB-dependent receptor [Pseudovibrio sp. M1P-2-3]